MIFKIILYSKYFPSTLILSLFVTFVQLNSKYFLSLIAIKLKQNLYLTLFSKKFIKVKSIGTYITSSASNYNDFTKNVGLHSLSNSM